MTEPGRPGDKQAGALPVSPSIVPILESVAPPPSVAPVNGRVALMAAISLVIGAGAAGLAELLMRLIGLITNLAYLGRWSTAFAAPDPSRLGYWSAFIPIIGAFFVGLMARYGAAAIRGHGIPEVMEKVLYGRSKISVRVMFLKPISAAIAIGTGGPFGAEGPIIATGGALGSIVGQILHITADERKTLLAAGAAAGMAATFGSPVSAVLLAVELLLFEYRPRSIIPVALASAVAAGMRVAIHGALPVFTIPELSRATIPALITYAVLGAAIGVVAVGVTRAVYWIEDLYEEIPVHWMWWPMIGAVFVGVIGLVEPRTLGVGYSNIEGVVAGTIVGKALIVLVVLKFISWAVYLGSGTSGGTLAPLFTIGGGLGAAAGSVISSVAPGLSVDPHIAGLVGMAAIFAGASHALLASVVFAFETTRQAMGLLPLLIGCTAAYLVSLLLAHHSIMTEKLARRGTPVRSEYTADHLNQVLVRDAATMEVVTLLATDTVGRVRTWLDSRDEDARHQGYPVLDAGGDIVGVVTRRSLFDPQFKTDTPLSETITRGPAVVFADNSLREAADHMVREGVGRLPVVAREAPRRVIGIVSRSDLLDAHEARLDAANRRETPSGGIRIPNWSGTEG